MKRKLSIIVIFVAIISLFCALTTFTAYADESQYQVKIISPASKEQYTQGDMINYTVRLEKNEKQITSYIDNDGDCIDYEFKIKLENNGGAEVKGAEINGNVVTITTKDLEKGDYTLTVSVNENDVDVSKEMKFTLKAAKKNYSTYILLGVAILLIVGIFFYSSRSNKKRQQQAQSVADNLAIGDQVKTIGGICGTVIEINHKEGTFVLQSGNSTTKFDKAAVYQTAKADEVLGEDKKTKETKEEPKEETEKTEEDNK